MNSENIKNQVDSSLTNLEFVELTVYDENSDVIYTKSKDQKFSSLLHKEIVVTNPNDDKEVIGTILLTYTLDNIHNHLLEKIYSSVIFNFIKTIVISFLLLQLFYSVAVKRLNTISKSIKNSGWPMKTEPIKESSDWIFKNKKDEINNIEIAFNNASDLISKNVAIITDHATSSARLAELGIFAAGIAHEINNPLAIITGNMAIMEKELKNLGLKSDKIKTYIDRNNNSVERIQKIISSIKMLSRDTSHDEVSELNIQSIVEDALVYCVKKLEVSQIKLSYSVEPPDLTLKCKHVEISQVLLNLVNNSIDAIEEKSTKWIDLKFTQLNDQVICVFTDSGTGIPLDIQSKVFLPFFTTKPVGKGTGLGLPMVHSILQKNAATIKINNHSSNTQFIITFENQSELKEQKSAA